MYDEYQNEVHWILLFISQFHVTFTQRVFAANFGVTPLICAQLWEVILESNRSVEPHHLLYFLCFVKTYSTFDDLSTKFRVTEKTVRTNVWKVARILYTRLQTVSLFQFNISISPYLFFSLSFFLC